MKNRVNHLPQSDKIVEYLLSVLKADENAEVHACVCIGLAKLLLSGMVTNTNVRACEGIPNCAVANPSLVQALETIFLLYVTPETSDNLELRQCLSYFFPVYCYSNAENQRKVKEVSRSARLFDYIYLPLDQLFLPMFAQITEMYSELEEGQTMVNPLQLASMLVDWMDPEKAVYVPPFYAFEHLLTISTGRWLAAERTIVSTSILLRTLSKPCLMTISRVRKNSPFPTLFLSMTSLLLRRRE